MPPTDPPAGGDASRFRFVLAAFSLATLASAGFTTNLIPALGEQAISPGTAAMFGGLMGVMQLPGRVVLMNGSLAGSPARLALTGLLLQSAGLGFVALAPSAPVVAAGIATFAIGAGLNTLVRPHLVQTVFGTHVAGALNGQLARAQQLARALGPILVAWLATGAAYSLVFGLLAIVLAAVALSAHHALQGLRPSIIQEELS